MIGRRAPLKDAQANASPNGGIGRPMKVGKEEQMGLLAAVCQDFSLFIGTGALQRTANARGAQVEQWVARDHVAEWSAWEACLETIADGASAFPTIEVRALPRLETYLASWNSGLASA